MVRLIPLILRYSPDTRSIAATLYEIIANVDSYVPRLISIRITAKILI